MLRSHSPSPLPSRCLRNRSRSASPHHCRHLNPLPPRDHPPRRSRSRSSNRLRHRARSRRREMPSKKIRIPDNWVDVAKMGTIVGNSRFVPLRVPLDAKYLPQFSHQKEEIWTPQDFIELQMTQNLDVKMIIDLTNTFKYYDGGQEFKETGVEYVKLKIEGFSRPPDVRDVAKFVVIVDDFIARKPDGIIAVHCTHGLNRTGYLIVTYMVKRLGYTVTGALEAFKEARPPGLIKHMYVKDLYQTLGEGEEIILPTLPDWAGSKYGDREVRKPDGYGDVCKNLSTHGNHLRFEE
ncbi:mrna-capping enzyme-like [Plasmopara halstedii]|uniref:Mrna-capping enzyme-like n=1 Tax=Plasmopara halstedii TaxID=4781 RepID=A0A0P1AGH0_PLAHL|nr:mrna-capping enzyme-like [Plasmopara halstedii]CEG40241.1 mrna-capping enzyme-like [Plasmopara halstedii]|eukprot:XP_024576610.1 mrna-capping enzyme-like [Plasmopara halstedii]